MKIYKDGTKFVAISPGTDTFPLNQSELVARTETFQKLKTGTNFGPFSPGTAA